MSTPIKKPTKAQERETLKEKRVFGKVTFGYSTNYVLPYDDAILMMQTFKFAEYFDKSADYSDPPICALTEENSPTLSIVSEAEYTTRKLKALIDKK